MLTYDLNKCGSLPKYLYLYQCIRDDILSGELKCNDRLPSKRSLAQHLNVGIITVAGAYDQLVIEGYVLPQERKGFFVQALPQTVQRTVRPPVSHPPEPSERTFFADFKANRISLNLFPVATWNQMMRKSICQNSERLFQTVPYNGIYDLRRAIADYLLRNRGMEVEPAQIIIGAGTEYLYGRISQLMGHAITFGFEDPGYKKLSAIAGSYGNPCVYVPIDECGLRVDMLEESGADVVHVSPSNHFPTGIVMPISRRMELFDWAYRAKKRYIIEDDYDSEFRYKGNYIPPLYMEDSRNKVIYINTFSKTLVPSLRISYMVLPAALMRHYQETMSFYSCTVSSFEQYALAAFISEGYFERHITRLKNYYRKLRLQLLSAIQNAPVSKIAQVVEFNSGTHFLLEVNTSLSPEEIIQAGLKSDLHLQLVSDFSHDELKTKNCTLVINYAGIAPESVSEVVERLGNLFPECTKKPAQ